MLIIFSLLLMVPLLPAQSIKAYKKAAKEALEKKDHQAALLYYQKALEQSPGDPFLKYQYAEMAFRFNAFNEARRAYLEVYESQEAVQFPMLSYQLSKVSQSLGNYDEAMAYLVVYQGQLKDEKQASEIRRQIEDLKWAKKDIRQASLWNVKRLGKRVNTAYSEFAPIPKGDTLFYTSFRYDKEDDDYQPQRKISKVLYRRGQSRGRPISRGFNASNQLTAHIAFSDTQQRMYFNRCDYINASEIRCDLYYKQRDKRGRWSKENYKLEAPVNLASYTTTQPSIGYDSVLQQEVLFFTSDRPGGKGQLDLWSVILYKDSTTNPQPLEALNTTEDDITPFFYTPQQRLYFSSSGYPHYGGLDVFYAEKSEKVWDKPIHLPAPVNSSYNDVYFSLGDNEYKGYLASNRPGSMFVDEDKQACCNDLYTVEYIPPTPVTEEEIVEIPTPPLPNIPPDVPVATTPPERLQDFLPLALYFDNDQPDPRTRKTSTNKTYIETYNTYIGSIDRYESEFVEPLEEERQEEALRAINDFFELEVEKGYIWLNKFSEILTDRLEKGDTLEIFLKGYTSPRAKKEYNLALSKRRISSVQNYFQNYQNGKLIPFLSSQQLKISERPFGEATAASTVSDVLEDLRNSVYHPDAARERRVEIVEILTN
jgi:hypothetical protein